MPPFGDAFLSFMQISEVNFSKNIRILLKKVALESSGAFSNTKKDKSVRQNLSQSM